MKKDSSILLIYVPCPSVRVAKQIAHAMIKSKLAACANILPNMESIYLWKQKVKADKESLLLLKTQSRKWKNLKLEIEKFHPYSVPCIVAFKSEKLNESYLDWIGTQFGVK